MVRFRVRFKQWLSKWLLSGSDRWLIILPAVLLLFGLLMLSSVSSIVAFQDFQDGFHYVKRQAFGILVGLGFLLFFANIPLKSLKKLAYPILIFNLILLVAVLFFGKEVNGSRAWFYFLGFQIQPSELLKITFITYLAGRLTDDKLDINHKIAPFFIMYVVVALLMVLQRDVGTLFVISMAAMTVFFISGAPVKHFLSIVLLGVVVFASLIATSTHQQERFRCLLEINYSPLRSCYQLNQSLIAIGSGGMFGRGFGESRQKFLYLPEVQNDFIFSIITEEMGAIVASGLIIVFAWFFYRVYLIAKNQNDRFTSALAVGLVSWICLQAVLNIGGIMRVLPMTGVPLPLISYGGSAKVASLSSIGILINISRQK